MSETTELAQQVADLTTSTTALTDTVVGQLDRLTADIDATDARANDALNSANAAEASAVEANQAKSDAKVEADKAKVSADNASAVVTGGTATLDSEAGKIPLADSEGKIDLDWLPAEAQGYNAFAQEQAVNGDKFAASGFVHFGKHTDTGSGNLEPINQGLYTYQLSSDMLFLGRGSNSPTGLSRTDFPVINVAGIQTSIDGLQKASGSDTSKGIIKFPDAPNGTVTYDSATGEIVDYTKDVDPKYGDVAPDVNEAVARAFEGEVKNGDFRLGDDGSWYLNLGAVATIQDGYVNFSNTSGLFRNSNASASPIVIGDKFRCEFLVRVNTPITGSFNLLFGLGVGTSSVGGGKFIEQDLEGLPLGTWVSVSGEIEVTDLSTTRIVLHSSTQVDGSDFDIRGASVHKVTTEVVTERVDMWGFEGYLEEVSVTNPYVYQNGLIQSQATDIDDVSTGDSNRPDTYYAVFDGDTTSRGKGVNFWSITDAQRKAIFSNPDNKLYLIDGKIYQWRLRQRTIAGAGNGDWLNIDSNSKVEPNSCRFGNDAAYVLAQGEQDSVISLGTGSDDYYQNTSVNSFFISNPELDADAGLFVLRRNGDSHGAFGHCYFLVCGTVSRLNSGFYKIGMNDFGSVADINGKKWTETAIEFNTKADCFNLDKISDAISGRSDGRLSQYIYSSGLGGVVLDIRYSAWDKSAPEHKAKALAMVENGTYRGVEKLVETKLGTQYAPDHSNTDGLIMGMPHDTLKIGCILFVENPSGTYEATTVISTYPSNSYGLTNGTGCNVSPKVGRKADGIVVYMQPKNHSVGGEFQNNVVYADPTHLLESEDFKDGWLGIWGGIPSGATMPAIRKALGSAMSANKSVAPFDAWASETGIAESVTNETPITLDADAIYTFPMTNFSKQTKPSTNQAVFNGEAGVGSVYFSSRYTVNRGVLLGEALAGVVNTDSGYRFQNSIVTKLVLDGDRFNNNLSTEHVELTFGAPSNNSTAFKTLTTQLSVNDQASIQFQYEELVHNGTDWGDDGEMYTTDSGDSTNTDENGNVVGCGVHELAVPYGWCKVEI